MAFVPKRIFFERNALDYPLGRELYGHFRDLGIPVNFTSSHNRIAGIPGKTAAEAYLEGKRTLAVGVRRSLQFETCRPSAHYQLPLVTGCSGKCEYCYLLTNMGKKPYLRIYVNIDEILAAAGNYIAGRAPDLTFFEGAATSDPIPVERYTGALRKTIEYFGGQELGRFRFVTKFTEVESLLDADHRGHTRFRFSINSEKVIKKYEHGTPGLEQRMAAAAKIAAAGYPLGFLIAPIITYPGWESDYTVLVRRLKESLGRHSGDELTFELISHRFTARAKKRILEVFPSTNLPLEEKTRKFKYGQFGYGKYVYRPEELTFIESFFKNSLAESFPAARLEYLV